MHNLHVTAIHALGEFQGYLNTKPMTVEQLESVQERLSSSALEYLTIMSNSKDGTPQKISLNEKVLTETILIFEIREA